MKIHEYQAKQILARYGVPIPKGEVAESVAAAVAAAERIGGESWVVKAQIHAGGRGKGGGVKLSRGLAAVRENATAILGMQLVTHQTGPQGRKVHKVLVEEGMDIRKELYLSMLVDRESKAVVVLGSTEGGMDIEKVAAETPEKILREKVDADVGLLAYQGTRMAYGLQVDRVDPKLVRPMAALIGRLYDVFMGEDCSLVEINPLVLTQDTRVLALDAKLTFDDSALYRHKEIQEMRDLNEEEPLEIEASDADLSYIKLDGNIGCMVNGAGLAMGTMDIIKSAGGEPANFLDIGGNADEVRVENAFRIITKDSNVKCVLINIFGGIVRCDVVAKGVVAAFKKVGVDVPVILRLEGINAEKAHGIIAASGLGVGLTMADGLGDAASKSVAAVSGS